MRVLVCHPGMQHAHQLAWALEEAGYLAAFWSGVPVVDSRNPGGGLWGVMHRYLRNVPVAANKRRHAVIFPLLRRLLGLRLFKSVSNDWSHQLDRAHDIWMARRVRKLRPDVVVCYENSALHTFKVAREIGAVCVLDAASIHYLAGRTWLMDTVRNNSVWIDDQKQQEIDLADAILTCSEFAAETYRVAGVPVERMFPVPLGTELPNVYAPVMASHKRCRFVFVGSLRRLKGADVLLDVFQELEQEGAPVELVLIGSVVEQDLAERAKKMLHVTHQPFMQQADLFQEVASHDCLILPSRFDSFGMVVAEAMAVGVPAIVSDRVGAKCIIEQHPDAGWIVPCEKAELKAQILRVVANRENLASAGRAARRAAQAYSWENYRLRVVQTLEGICARYGKSATWL